MMRVLRTLPLVLSLVLASPTLAKEPPKEGSKKARKLDLKECMRTIPVFLSESHVGKPFDVLELDTSKTADEYHMDIAKKHACRVGASALVVVGTETRVITLALIKYRLITTGPQARPHS